MTELAQKQIIFSRYLGLLLNEFYDHHLLLGEVWRSPETCALYAKEGKGIKDSVHSLRLAIDITIWTSQGPSIDKKVYQELALFWKELPQLYPDDIAITTCWGGDFTSFCDFYHYSIEHNGVR